MKRIGYQFVVSIPSDGEAQDQKTYLQNKSILCTDDMLEANLAAAKVEAYNGEVTVEDVPDTRPLEAIKAERIQLSKTDLAAYLESHPIQWTDGEQYSITAEKQQQLTGKILSATLAQQTSTPYTLTWNSTGQVCKEWTLEELGKLAFAIDARVTALVTYQQTQEVAMRDAESLEALAAIEVDYDTVE